MTGLTVASERPDTIFIGTRSRFAKGAGHVWRYQLSYVGAQRIYVCLQPPSTTHENDVMFIVPQLEGETVFYVAYEGRVVNGELEQRAAVFRTVVLLHLPASQLQDPYPGRVALCLQCGSCRCAAHVLWTACMATCLARISFSQTAAVCVVLVVVWR